MDASETERAQIASRKKVSELFDSVGIVSMILEETVLQ